MRKRKAQEASEAWAQMRREYEEKERIEREQEAARERLKLEEKLTNLALEDPTYNYHVHNPDRINRFQKVPTGLLQSDIRKFLSVDDTANLTTALPHFRVSDIVARCARETYGGIACLSSIFQTLKPSKECLQLFCNDKKSMDFFVKNVMRMLSKGIYIEFYSNDTATMDLIKLKEMLKDSRDTNPEVKEILEQPPKTIEPLLFRATHFDCYGDDVWKRGPAMYFNARR